MRRNSRWLLYSLIWTVALVITGCNRNIIYHHYEPTPLEGWEKSDTLRFTLPAAKKRSVVQRDVELRISANYPYQNITLIVEQTTLPANLFRRDTVNCRLFSPDGNILGQGQSLYQFRFQMPDISLNEGDSLCIQVRHNMKREILPGIADVGIRLTAY